MVTFHQRGNSGRSPGAMSALETARGRRLYRPDLLSWTGTGLPSTSGGRTTSGPTGIGSLVRASGQFAGGEMRNATKEFLIFAVGEPSPQVAAILQQAPDIVRIIWRQAPYTHAELSREMRRIMRRFSGRLTSGGARHEGTGIEFTTTDSQLLEATDPQAVLGSRYPVTIEYMEPAIEG